MIGKFVKYYYQWYSLIYITAFLLAVEPTFLFPPENFIETVDETDSVTLICSVVGIPAPSISFYQSGTLLDQGTDQRITLTDNSEPQDFQTATGTVFLVSRNLTLDNTTDADSGTYTCVASNGNAVTPNVIQIFELFVNGKSGTYSKYNSMECRVGVVDSSNQTRKS